MVRSGVRSLRIAGSFMFSGVARTTPGVDHLFVRLAAQAGRRGPDAVVPHAEGVLEHEALELLFLQRLDEFFRRIESDLDNPAGEPVVFEGPQAAEGRRLVRGEDRVDVGKTGEEVLGRLVGRLRGDAGVLVVREDRDSRKPRLDGLEESVLALPAALDALDDADQDNVSAAPEQRADVFRSQPPPLRLSVETYET